MAMRPLRIGILVAVFPLLAGCAPSLPGVTGSVQLHGSPVDGAIVRFHWPDGTPATAPVFFAMTRADGTFEIPAGDRTRAGPPTGSFVVTIVKYKDKPVMGLPRETVAAMKSLLPAEYASPKTTPLLVELKPGGNHFEFQLSRTGK
jgi:hypothetical protein